MADLMECFNQTRVTNDKFPWFKEAIDNLKDMEGGRKSMCQIMDDYSKEEAIDNMAYMPYNTIRGRHMTEFTVIAYEKDSAGRDKAG